MKSNTVWTSLGLVALGCAGVSGQVTSLPPTVVSAEVLEDEGDGFLPKAELDLFTPESVEDLSGLVPGFHVVSGDSGGYGHVFTMRGSGNTLFFGPPAVGVTVDGVPQGSAFAYANQLLELESVRIRRGPQGAYHGRNAAAGLVELRTPGPTADYTLRLGAEYGSADLLGATVRSSGPLWGDFSHTLQLYYRERDGFIRNNFLGGKRDDREVFGGRAKIFWNPSDRFEGWMSFAAERVDDGSQRLSSLANPFASPNPFEVASDRPGVTEIERYSWNSSVTRTFDWGSLTSVGGMSWWDLDPSTVDLDLSHPAINGGSDAFSIIEHSQDLLTREIRIDSPEDHAVRWQAGLHFLKIENEGTAFRQLFPGGEETTEFDLEETGVAFFANAAADLSDTVRLGGGVRVQYHESEIDRLKTSTLAADAPVSGSQDDVYVSPTLEVTYAASDTLSFFVRSGLGIKPAGFTAYSDDPAGARFDEETNWSSEIGLEYTPTETVRASLRAYWNQIDDYQVNQSLGASTDFVITNAEEVTALGIEAELSWQPVENLTIRGSVGYADTEFDRYLFTDPTVATTFDFSNNPVPFVPEFTGNLAVRYDFGNGFYAQSSVRATGKTYYDSAGTEGFAEDSYFIWNAQVGYEGDGFTVAVYGNNLLDEEYYTFINPQIFAGAPGDPQVFGVRVTKDF